VDHPLPPPDVLVRPWRVAAFVAASIAAVELLLLLAIGGSSLAHAVSSRVEIAARDHALAPAKKHEPATSTRKRTPPAPAKLPRDKTVVLVLNGNGRTGAAATAAARVTGRGYKIGAVGNAGRTDFPQSFVMFKPGFSGEGRRLAHDLGLKRVGPLDGMRINELGRAHAVLILGA
jgi:hypothetical protein